MHVHAMSLLKKRRSSTPTEYAPIAMAMASSTMHFLARDQQESLVATLSLKGKFLVFKLTPVLMLNC